jgi:hypothetical protein
MSQCGPWTLDQLDAFGSLESLAFSLDDPIWESPDTCILDAQAQITGVGTLTADTSKFIGVQAAYYRRWKPFC